MIQMGTVATVADNSGAKKVRCIKVLGGSNIRVAHVAHVVRVAVQQVVPNQKVQKGQVYFAVVVRTKKGVARPNGTVIRFSENAVVLLNDQKQLIGTRIFGPVPSVELRSKFMKVVSLAEEVH
ncbi:50S ribosomal protein L14 [Gammaproteobacteria bacterium]|nr:50S ribosomal protein L14 [Gammaproteobacteria bacterium]